MKVKRVNKNTINDFQFLKNSFEKHRQKQIVIEAKNLKKNLSKKHILTDVNLKVYRGEIIGIGGAVGSGKTTLLYTLIGLIEADSGKVLYKNKELNSDSLQEINFASSSSKLNGYASVLENLRTFAGLYDIKNSEEKIASLCEKFSLLPLLKTKVYNLSGGENCRLNLCKAFLNDPQLVLLDEITSHLDHYSRLLVAKFLEEQKKEGKSIIFVGHDIQELIQISDRIFMLHNGILKEENSKTIKNNLKKYFQ